jgi:6-pyruvoyltetrahydropterin/6-carboxytetrahydropterin synthase
MFEISVEKDFDAAHFLRGYKGKCESLHGHRFKVIVTVQTKQLDEIGMGYDFSVLKQQLGEILEKFDHTCLNDLRQFKKNNPSSENIAVSIYSDLQKKLKTAPAKLTSVEVWESPQNHVIYRPD